MSFKKLLGESVTVLRMTAVSGDKTKFLTLTTTLNAHRRIVDPQKSLELGGSVGKMFKFYFEEGADIADGDILIDESDGTRYQITAGGVDLIDNIGGTGVRHIEALAKKLD